MSKERYNSPFASYLGAAVVATILVALAFWLLADAAHGRELRISVTREVPTVAGIRPDPVYRPRIVGSVTNRPAAAILSVRGEAPANGCEGVGGGFRVASGPASGRGCFGGP